MGYAFYLDSVISLLTFPSLSERDLTMIEIVLILVKFELLYSVWDRLSHVKRDLTAPFYFWLVV